LKKAIGLDQARFLLFGAAPLAADIRQYFLSLNMFLINGYGNFYFKNHKLNSKVFAIVYTYFKVKII
jgi:hypothetical protein